MARVQSEDRARPVAVTLLGRFSIQVSEQDEVRLPHKAQQLLAYLIVHHERGHHRESLAGLLWCDSQGDARKQLRQTLWLIQSQLEGQVPAGGLIVQSGDWVALSTEATFRVDLWTFEKEIRDLLGSSLSRVEDAALPRAVAVERRYQGHLLEGWTEPWCQEPREQALRLYTLLLDALLDSYGSAEDQSKVILYATRALAVDPTRETAHRALIRALHQLGDRSGALRQYQRCVDALREEHGVEPTAETNALIERVRAETTKARGKVD
jgi:DNA-binding SARP family transcriptional activator